MRLKYTQQGGAVGEALRPTRLARNPTKMFAMLSFFLAQYSQAGLGKQLWLLLGAGWVLAPVLSFVDRFLWSDWEFVVFLAVLVILDTLTGLVRAWQQRAISSARFQRVVVKVFAYAVVLVALHALSRHTVHGAANPVLKYLAPYLDATVYTAVLLREVLSIHENLAAVGFRVLPRFLTRRMRDFNESGEYQPGPSSQA